MDPHPTPFPGKTRRSVATSGKSRPEQGKSGAREPNIIAARYNQVPQRRVFGTIRSTNAKVEDTTTNPFQKTQQTASKSVTRTTRKTAFVVHTASLKKQYTDNSPKDARQQAAGSADAKKKAMSVSFREPLPGKSDGCSPMESKEHGAVKKHATVSFREPLTGKGIKGDSPTETKKQAGSSERKRNSLTKDAGSSERKRNSLTKDAGSSGKKRAGRVAKQAGSFPDVKVPVVVAARVRQPLIPGKRRSVGSATMSGVEEEPQTPAPVVAAAKEAAQQASATPYLSARDCSKCRLDRLETASYWITQIKLAESTGKHFVAAEFFRLAYQCNAEPFRRLKSELSSYVERHLTVSKAWPDVCRLYGLLEDEPAANFGPTPAVEELTKTMEAASGSGHEDVAALLALEGEVMEKSETSSAIASLESSTGCEVDSEDCCECCLVPGVGTVSAYSLVKVAADETHVQGRDGLTGNSPLRSSVKGDIYCDATSSSSDYQMEEEFSGKATDAQLCSTEDSIDIATECHEESDENIKTLQLGETDAVAVSTGDACL